MLTCRVCGGPLSEARAALNLTLCSGACHRAARKENPMALSPDTCPERDSHGKPFRYCPVKGCGWIEGDPQGEPDPADECMSTDIDNCAVHGSFPSQQGR